MADEPMDAQTQDMANVLATALSKGDLAVAVADPPKAEAKPEVKAEPKPGETETPIEPKPEVKPDDSVSALAQTQAQLAALSENMNRLVESLGREQARVGEPMPKTPSELQKLAADPQATEEARLVATEMLGIKENLEAIKNSLEGQIQARFDAEYEAEMAAFHGKYPKFTDAEVKQIDKAFGDAVEKNPALADTLSFEEFAVRLLGGYEPLLARRAAPNSPRKDEPIVPGGKPPAKVVTESATGGGRASLGKPLDRHATQDDVSARISAGLQATR